MKHRFDSIVVDEAQDFADSWWSPLLGALYDDEEGGLYVYSDENQRIFARFGRPPVPLVPLVLDHNLRNTKQIHAAFGPLAPSRMYARGRERARRSASWPPRPTRLSGSLTTRSSGSSTTDGGRRTSCCSPPDIGTRCRWSGPDPTDDQKAYWRTYWENDDVFYGHVLGCKGLERRAVVLCVNEATPRERGRERFYVGMSRATDVLVVVGDPDMIREMGGDAVAKQLGI